MEPYYCQGFRTAPRSFFPDEYPQLERLINDFEFSRLIAVRYWPQVSTGTKVPKFSTSEAPTA